MTPTAISPAPSTKTPSGSAPCWSSRAFTEQDRDEVLALFTESDFYFRTWEPDTRPEREILELVGDDTRVLLADGQVAGLYALESEGSAHGCHYVLHLRLRASAPLLWWTSAYHEVVRAARWRHEVVRLAIRFAEFDERGLRTAYALGLTNEGTLSGVIVRDGRRQGKVFFSQIWKPES
jgi:hypothetical protein